MFLDETKGLFTVARRLNEEENPDIVPLSAVTSCRLEIKEEREEEEYQDQNGESRSYVPPRYHYSYDYKIKLSVNTPWFDDMDFQLNTFSVEGHERNKIMQYEQLETRSYLLLRAHRHLHMEIHEPGLPTAERSEPGLSAAG